MAFGPDIDLPVRALNQIDFQMPQGKTLGIVGESGSGKSVTSLSINRLIPNPPGKIESGEIIYNGSIDFGYFNISTMPMGGNPALAVDGSSIAVSGVIDTSVITGSEPKGTGIAYSTNTG